MKVSDKVSEVFGPTQGGPGEEGGPLATAPGFSPGIPPVPVPPTPPTPTPPGTVVPINYSTGYHVPGSSNPWLYGSNSNLASFRDKSKCKIPYRSIGS